MLHFVEAIYTNAWGQERFRELLMQVELGLPDAVRHRDGTMYVLARAGKGRAVFRDANSDPPPRQAGARERVHSAFAN